jgi:hypothetical protein
MQFPLVVVCKGSKTLWDKTVKDLILEEIKRDGFDHFTMIDWETAKSFVEFEFKCTKKKTKKSKKTKAAKKKEKKDESG